MTKKLTTKQKMFLKEYFKSGNGTAAAMKSYNCKDRNTAASIANENLRKLEDPVKQLMEAKGLTMGKLIDVLSDATEANKIHGTQDDFIEIPDHPTRLKAVDTASKWLGVDKSRESSNIKRRIVAEEFFGD
ncbi:MAG: terminase small subunit [Nanoarchaeota archaeon]|nr:terminase small subunit [Nanoarchaeota archaeon]